MFNSTLTIKYSSSVLGLLISYHQSIQQSLFSQLKSPRLAVRKRSIIALGMLHNDSFATYYMYIQTFLTQKLSLDK